jgi:predicted transport protein
MSQSPEAALQSMIDNLAAKTGKPLAEWVKLVKKSGLARHGEIVAMLKQDHGITHGYANLVAHQALGSDAVSVAKGGTDLVADQYGGTKAALRPIYDLLAKKVLAFGKDVELSPKKAYVSLRRSKQFGLVQPSTATRVDVGLNLKGVAPKGRLEASGSFNAMCTHRVRLESPKDVDAELVGWLKQAYDRA